MAVFRFHFSFRSYYLQHFVDSFRQGVIDLLLGNLDDISDICIDDPLEQITNIAQCALIPQLRAPIIFNYSGVMGNDLKFIEDSISFVRCMTFLTLFFLCVQKKILIMI